MKQLFLFISFIFFVSLSKAQTNSNNMVLPQANQDLSKITLITTKSTNQNLGTEANSINNEFSKNEVATDITSKNFTLQISTVQSNQKEEPVKEAEKKQSVNSLITPK